MRGHTSIPLCYSPFEAAKVLGIGRSTLFTLLAKGELKASKLGTRTLIRRRSSSATLERYRRPSFMPP